MAFLLNVEIHQARITNGGEAMSLEEKINDLRSAFEKEPATIPLEQLKNRYVGREGKVRDLFNELKTVPADQKGPMGQKLNALKAELEEKISARGARPVAASRAKVDLTL